MSKPISEWDKSDFDAAFGPGTCMHRRGVGLLVVDEKFKCPDCGEVFDVPPYIATKGD